MTTTQTKDESMNSMERFQTYSRPSVRAAFDPYINRLLESIAREEWLDAQLDLLALVKLVQQSQLNEKLKETGAAGVVVEAIKTRPGLSYALEMAL